MLRRTILLVAALAMMACGREGPVSFQSTDITGAEFGRTLALTDHHGQSRTLTDFRGKAVVVFFGYTSCPDVCPTTLARYAEVLRQLGDDGSRVQVLFVTIDPARDTREKLAAYVPWFHPSFIGLYGDVPATETAAREFKVFYGKKETGGDMAYVLDHTAAAYVFDPAGRIRLYVKDDAPADAIVRDLKILLAGN